MSSMEVRGTILYILSFCMLSSLISAQDFNVNVEFYGVENGLSHRDVQCVHQDQQGFIWLGTNYGLNRFDGYEFKWYTEEKHGLQSNMINHIIEDDEGLMWLIYTTNRIFQFPVSIDLFDPITEQIESFESKFGDDLPFDFRDITSFTTSDSGQLALVTSENQLILYSKNTGFQAYPLNIPGIRLSRFSRHGTLWCISMQAEREKIIEIDLTGKIINVYDHNKNLQRIFIAGVDDNDDLWYILKYSTTFPAIEKGEIYRIDSLGQQHHVDPNEKTTLSDPVFLNENVSANQYNFWMNTSQESFWLFDRFHFQVFHVKSGWHCELSSEHKWLLHMNALFHDSSDRAWACSEFGLYKIELRRNPFYRLDYSKHGTNFRGYRGITTDVLSNVWACMDRGPGFLDIYAFENDQYELIASGIDDSRWGANYKYGIMSDGRKHIWFASGQNSEILKYNSETNDTHVIPYSITRLIGHHDVNIWSFYEDKEGLVWFGTDAGVIGYVDKQSTVVLLPELEGVNEKGGCIYQFLEDRNGIVWIATDDGLHTLDTKNKKIHAHPSDDLLFNQEGIFHIHEDIDGSLWLGTRGLGLIKWQPGSDGFERFSKSDGLSDNTIYAVYPDDHGHLWLSSDYGIMRFDTTSNRTTAYLVQDGITHNEFNRISHHKGADGQLYFGGLNGITIFHPDQFLTDTNTANQPLVITRFQQFDGDQNQLVDKTLEIRESDKITLAPGDRFFRLEFALLTYDNANNVQYAYKVEGVDTDWTYQDDNSIRLSRLPYGSHTLRIRGQSADGQWSKNEIELDVSVIKPVWLRWWFLVLIGIAMLFGVYVFFRQRTNQLRRQKSRLELEVAKRTATIEQQAEKLRQLDQMKSRFFANVSHELRTPLTLMLGPISSALKTGELRNRTFTWLQTAQQNGKQLLKLVNEILDLSKLESGKLELEESSVALFTFLRRIVSSFESHVHRNGLELNFEYHADNNLNLKLDKKKVETVLNNLLSNAIKFTPRGGAIHFSIKDNPDRVQMCVRDTGRGIHPDDQPFIFDRFYQSNRPESLTEGGTGIGLALSRELAKQMNGRLYVESELNKGSTFFFEFPRKEVLGVNVDHLETPDSDEESLVASSTALVAFDEDQDQKTASAERSTILLVEDNYALARYMQSILSDLYVVQTAENGDVALEILNESSTQRINLIISDIMMPVMDGFQLLERLKSDQKFQHLPVIMLTARADLKDKLKALRIGVDDYLLKPFEEEELLVRIENVLRNYGRRKSIARSEAIPAGTEALSENGDSDAEALSESDLKWLESLEEVVLEHLGEPHLNIERLADALAISRRNFFRRVKQLTGLTPNEYLREARLQHARGLLENRTETSVKAAAISVGFTDTKYFSRLFNKRFAKLPSEFL